MIDCERVRDRWFCGLKGLLREERRSEGGETAGRARAAGRGRGPGFGFFLVPCHRIVPYGRVYNDGRYVRIYVRMCVGSGGVFQVCSILL
jgi:hypothetical protein